MVVPSMVISALDPSAPSVNIGVKSGSAGSTITGASLMSLRLTVCVNVVVFPASSVATIVATTSLRPVIGSKWSSKSKNDSSATTNSPLTIAKAPPGFPPTLNA